MLGEKMWCYSCELQIEIIEMSSSVFGCYQISNNLEIYLIWIFFCRQKLVSLIFFNQRNSCSHFDYGSNKQDFYFLQAETLQAQWGTLSLFVSQTVFLHFKHPVLYMLLKDSEHCHLSHLCASRCVLALLGPTSLFQPL